MFTNENGNNPLKINGTNGKVDIGNSTLKSELEVFGDLSLRKKIKTNDNTSAKILISDGDGFVSKSVSGHIL